MAYDLYIYDKSSFGGGWSGLFENWEETNLGKENQSFSTNDKLSGVKAHIDDNDASFDDDNGRSNAPNPGVVRQTLSEPLTINGTTYPPGTKIEMGFVANVENSAGELGRFYSIKVGDDIVGLAVASPETYPQTVGGRHLETGLKPNETYKVISANNGNGAGTKTAYDAFVCFTAGTMIDTPNGAVAVEDLCPGDLVTTLDHGVQPVRWTGRRTLSAAELADHPNLRPIRIRAGALCEGVPTADLLVSPQHRVLVRSGIAQRLFGTNEILVAAKQLCQLDGIDVAEDTAGADYIHILFDRHEVIMSNGAPTESLYTGKEALKSVGEQAVAEIRALFPALLEDSYTPTPARAIASGRLGRKLAFRHKQNQKPLLS